MIRDASPADIPDLVEMGRRFHAASPFAHLMAFSPERFASTVRGMIDAGQFVRRTDRGMFAGLVTPCYFAEGATAHELFWWAEDGQGLALFRAFEAWARDRGAVAVNMVSLADNDRPGKAYRRMGYAPAERGWVKGL